MRTYQITVVCKLVAGDEPGEPLHLSEDYTYIIHAARIADAETEAKELAATAFTAWYYDAPETIEVTEAMEVCDYDQNDTIIDSPLFH